MCITGPVNKYLGESVHVFVSLSVAQKMDYSKLSLTQAKRLEMESQVKALELEKELEMERTRLAELRKVHYHLAGSSEGWEEVSGVTLKVEGAMISLSSPSQLQES